MAKLLAGVAALGGKNSTGGSAKGSNVTERVNVNLIFERELQTNIIVN